MVTSIESLSLEILLRILGYLDSAQEVARVQQVNRHLHAVAADSLLWKKLFIRNYLQSSKDTSQSRSVRPGKRRRLSRDSVAPVTTEARMIRALPMMPSLASSASKALNEDEDDSDRRIDWYSLYKISRNWQTGNFSAKQLHGLQEQVPSANSTEAGPSQLSPPVKAMLKSSEATHFLTLVDSTSTHIFTAFNDYHSPPTIFAFDSNSTRKAAFVDTAGDESLARYSLSSSTRLGSRRITCLAVDKADSGIDKVWLFVGLSDGRSSLLYFNPASKSFREDVFIDKEPCKDGITSAVLHYPLLATCTFGFRIRIYRIDVGPPRLIEERRSYSCHWPACLQLEPLRTVSKQKKRLFRFSIAYSSPTYPSGWTVGLQEIVFDLQTTLASRSANARRAHVVTRIDSLSKSHNSSNTSSDKIRQAEVGRLTSLSYKDPFIVVGTHDNNVVCYRVQGTTPIDAQSSAFEDTQIELSHICTFQGHTGTVHSVSLNDGRCVTGGSDGSVRVWRLGDEEAALARAAGLLTTIDAGWRRGLGKVVTIASSASSKRKRDGDRDGDETSALPLTLSDILREAKNSTSLAMDKSSAAVVRWVTSAFDHIISVSATRTVSRIGSSALNSNCRVEKAAVEREEEQVQIWNFAY